MKQADYLGPVLELGAECFDMRGKGEGVDVRAEDVGAEEGFGFDGHGVVRRG